MDPISISITIITYMEQTVKSMENKFLLFLNYEEYYQILFIIISHKITAQSIELSGITENFFNFI